MGLVLDEPREDDVRFELEGLLWVMTERDQQVLMQGAQGFRVDHVRGWTGAGFVISRIGAAACC